MVPYIRYSGYLFKSDYKLHLVTKYMKLPTKLIYLIIFSGTYYYPISRDKIFRCQKIKIFIFNYDIKFYHKIQHLICYKSMYKNIRSIPPYKHTKVIFSKFSKISNYLQGSVLIIFKEYLTNNLIISICFNILSNIINGYLKLTIIP